MAEIVVRIRWWQFVASILVAGTIGALVGEHFNSARMTGFVSSFLGIIVTMIYLQAARKKSN